MKTKWIHLTSNLIYQNQSKFAQHWRIMQRCLVKNKLDLLWRVLHVPLLQTQKTTCATSDIPRTLQRIVITFSILCMMICLLWIVRIDLAITANITINLRDRDIQLVTGKSTLITAQNWYSELMYSLHTTSMI